MRVLFVCLGNICRSPLAEGILQSMITAESLDWTVDSAGTAAYHVGDPADRRSIQVAAKHGIVLTSRARQVRASDHEDFDLLIAMDASNARDLGRSPRVVRMRDYDPQGTGDVPDPYYGGPEGFDEIYTMLTRCCESLLQRHR